MGRRYWWSREGYGGHWIRNGKQAKTFDEADIIVLNGGGDIGTEIYGEKAGSYTHTYKSQRDIEEIEIYNMAVSKGKVLFGICRGAQLLTALQPKGKLIQHTTHGGGHKIFTNDGKTIYTNSIHHQMCYPWDMNKDEYEVLGWTLGLSAAYLGENDQQVDFPGIAFIKNLVIEPEILYFPKIKALATQWHPEMMSDGTEAVQYVNDLLDKYFPVKEYPISKREEKSIADLYYNGNTYSGD